MGWPNGGDNESSVQGIGGSAPSVIDRYAQIAEMKKQYEIQNPESGAVVAHYPNSIFVT